MFQFYNAWTLEGLDLVATESTSDNFSNAYSFLFHVCRYIAFVLVYALIGMGLHSWELPHTSVYYRHGTNGCYMEQLHIVQCTTFPRPPSPPNPNIPHPTPWPIRQSQEHWFFVLYITGTLFPSLRLQNQIYIIHVQHKGDYCWYYLCQNYILPTF